MLFGNIIMRRVGMTGLLRLPRTPRTAVPTLGVRMLVDESGMHKGAAAAAPIRKQQIFAGGFAVLAGGFAYLIVVPDAKKRWIENELERTPKRLVERKKAKEDAKESRVFAKDSWLGFTGDVLWVAAVEVPVITLGVAVVAPCYVTGTVVLKTAGAVDKTAGVFGLDFWNSKKKK